MATLRKYSRDWFFFDRCVCSWLLLDHAPPTHFNGRKLKAASDELGAAREDRDLFPSGPDDLPHGIPATVMVHDVGDAKDGSQLSYSEDDKRKDCKRIEEEISRLPKKDTMPLFETEAEEPVVTSKCTIETPRRGRRHCNDGIEHQQQQQRNPPNNSPSKAVGVRQISPPPSQPVSPLNPSPYCSKSRGHNRLYSFDSSTTNVDPDTGTKMQKLKLDHERLSSELNALPVNSKEWRDIKWRIVNLEEQLEDIENSSNSTCGRSGWTSLSDEDEILSHTDSTELSLVMEALALQNRIGQPASQTEQCVLVQDAEEHCLAIEACDGKIDTNPHLCAAALLFPEDEFKSCRKDGVARVPVSADAKAGEPWDAAAELVNVKTASSTIKEEALSPQEQMRSLSQECMRLSQRMRSLPRFSPEWTLLRV